MSKARILIVDDEETTRELFAELLQRWDYDVDQTADGHEALKIAAETHPDVIISDLVMPKLDGLALVRALREEQPDTPVVIITGKGTIDAAVEAVREGVFDFVEKPLDPARLKIILQRALEKKETLHEMQVLRRRLGQMDLGRRAGGQLAAHASRHGAGGEGRSLQGQRGDHRARAAPARSWWRAPSTSSARAATSPSSRSTARPFPPR